MERLSSDTPLITPLINQLSADRSSSLSFLTRMEMYFLSFSFKLLAIVVASKALPQHLSQTVDKWRVVALV